MNQTHNTSCGSPLVYRAQLYCISGNFRENLIFANSVKRHTCDVKISRLGHDLPITVIDSVISRFARISFSRNFAYAKFHENKTLAKISEFTVLNVLVDE